MRRDARRRDARPVFALAAAALLGLPGCDAPDAFGERDALDSRSLGVYAPSDFFYDGKVMRPTVEGTVARGHLDEDVAFETGKEPGGPLVTRLPLAVDETLLARGAERFAIYCAPCHDERGEGKGTVAVRGRLPATNLLEPRLRGVPDGLIFRAIRDGTGLMPAYRSLVDARDRWAIVAHVRALQGAEAGPAGVGAAKAEVEVEVVEEDIDWGEDEMEMEPEGGEDEP